MTGITLRLRNLVSMAVASHTPAERFWVDRVQRVSNSASIIVPLFTPSKTHSDYMVYNTGSRDDWDYISRITEDPAWTWDAMAPYRDLNQKYVPPNDGHDDVSQKHTPSLFPTFIILPRRTSTSHQHTAATGWYPSVFLDSLGLLIRELLRPSPNRLLRPIFLSNGT